MLIWQCVSLLLLLLSGSSPTCAESADEKSAECLMWDHLENKTLPLQNEGHAKCATNSDCTGFECEGTFKESPVKFGMNVLNCQDPPGLEIFGSAPHFLAANFSHVFKHGSKYEIPAAMLNLQDLSGLPAVPFSGGKIPGMNLYFVVNMEPNYHNESFNTLKIGLVVQACLNHSALNVDANVRKSRQLDKGEVCIINKPVIENTEIPVPHCPTTYPAQPLVGDPCSDQSGCGDHQTCADVGADNTEGVCECMYDYVKKADRTCTSREAAYPSLVSNSLDSPPPPLEAQPRVATSSSSSGAVAAGVISVLIVVVVLAGAVILVRRHRLLPRLQAKLRNTPYEDIVIGENSSSNSNNNNNSSSTSSTSHYYNSSRSDVA